MPATAAQARTYEIQRLSNGRWLLDSVGDDKKVAIAMANALMKSGRAPLGVQVMAVQRDAGGEFKEIRVYRVTPEEQQGAAAAQVKAGPLPKRQLRVERPRVEEDAEGRLVARAPRRAKKSEFSLRDWKVLVAIGFVLLWCAAFYVWRQPQTSWAFDRPEAQTNVKQRVPLP